ncbi:MAG: hypothetical protein R2911_20800 [Caldilineaceae bacterium]
MNRWHIIFLLTLILAGGWVWLSRVPVGAQPRSAAQPAVRYPRRRLRCTLSDKRGVCAGALFDHW